MKTVQLNDISSRNDISFISGPNSMPEIEPLETIFGADFRKSKRFKTTATVAIEIPSSENLFYAQMKNFSHEGMGIETSTSIKPETEVKIHLDRPLFISARETYDSTIRWCKGMTDEDGVINSFG